MPLRPLMHEYQNILAGICQYMFVIWISSVCYIAVLGFSDYISIVNALIQNLSGDFYQVHVSQTTAWDTLKLIINHAYIVGWKVEGPYIYGLNACIFCTEWGNWKKKIRLPAAFSWTHEAICGLSSGITTVCWCMTSCACYVCSATVQFNEHILVYIVRLHYVYWKCWTTYYLLPGSVHAGAAYNFCTGSLCWRHCKLYPAPLATYVYFVYRAIIVQCVVIHVNVGRCVWQW